MAYRRSPWVAKVWDPAVSKSVWLGNFETQAEAERIEDDYRRARGIPLDPQDRQAQRAHKAAATRRNLGLYARRTA